MAVIKCKMCGGDLALVEGQSVAECEYCGSKQTVPSADNEKKLTLFARANRLRASCEFDKAAGIYESIVAEFPEEAESYWGLVLCKYGIEYVDDPATGKKIPTCHRSSFESIMEDADFEQALENADPAARRVYREEAKQIEEIRKGIIAVSSNEQPYDIFICYKETDENGDRTLDSVLAQDVYDALTGKGYRVFFSRITLEDKLGQAYEPYIFAALNSAKIMLAVGTCYEHYNAVWVKNEWSRYLKIVAQDKNKYLIPCYKGIDAYDMPKEFAHLQGQDMGKVGAIADLIRGIEKLIPRQNSNTVVAQEKVVVGNAGGNNKIASLLDRGNMALEDGDWAKADSFFEDVLNNDSKNAQAYLGKTLAQERCRTMDALVRKRKDVYQNVRSETLYIPERTAHINEMAERCSLNGYVSADSIRKLYVFDLGYTSEVSGRQKQYREEESWWQNHRWLSRAEKFAVGAVAETIQNEKKHLFAQLSERVKKAQEADAKAAAKLEATYDAHITETDKKAEEIYEEGAARRETDYQRWLDKAKKETNSEILQKIAAKFDGLGDYKDSRNLATHCRKRAADEQAKIDAEHARKAEATRMEAEARAKRSKKISMIATPFVIAAIVFMVIMKSVIIPNGKYSDAVVLMDAGKYEEAIAAFEEIENYKDSAQRLLECKYSRADALVSEGQYQQALDVFTELEGYSDADAKLRHTKYLHGVQLEHDGEYETAYQYWEELGNYEDVKERLKSYAAHPRKILADGITWTYTYDAQGHMLRETKIIHDFQETITDYTYDSQGRCIKEYSVVTTEKNGGSKTTIKYEYDDAGKLLKTYVDTDYGYHAIREYSYDEYGNCTQCINMSDGEIISTKTYHYDSDGNCVKYTTDSSTEVYTYDNGLRIRSEHTSKSGTTTTEYHYDEDGQLIREDIHEANGRTRTIAYSYDLAGKLLEETETDANKTTSTKYLDYFIVYQPVTSE